MPNFESNPFENNNISTSQRPVSRANDTDDSASESLSRSETHHPHDRHHAYRRRRHRHTSPSSSTSRSRSHSRHHRRYKHHHRSPSSSSASDTSTSDSDASSSDAESHADPKFKYTGRNSSTRAYALAKRPHQPKYWPKNNIRRKEFAYLPAHSPAAFSQPFSADEVQTGWRRKLQIFLDDPSSSTAAMYFALFIAALIVLSSLGVIYESVPANHNQQSAAWFYSEVAVMAVFSMELAIRCYAHSTSWKQFRRFFFSFSNFIDMFAIIPYYYEYYDIAVRNDASTERRMFHSLTVFRLFRLIRLLHCYGYSSVLQLSMDAMFIAIKKSADALIAILFFQFFIIIIFSTLLFFCERGTWDGKRFVRADGEQSHFDSIPATFWFVAEVITTVGLGDVYPVTPVGKLLTFPLMIFGLLIIALPSIVLGKNFAEAWLWLKTSGNFQKQQKQRALALAQQRTKTQAKAIKAPPRDKSQKPPALDGTGTRPHPPGPADHLPSILSTAELSPLEAHASPVYASTASPEHAMAIQIDAPVSGAASAGTTDDKEAAASELQNGSEDDAFNEQLNAETMRSNDHAYYVSTAALIQSQNQDEILQLVQILVEQFQAHTQVIERLSMQQDDLLATVTNLKRMQQKAVMSPITETSLHRSRSRSRRSRSRSRSTSSNHSAPRSSSPRGRSRGHSSARSAGSARSHSRSPSRSSATSASRSRDRRRHHHHR